MKPDTLSLQCAELLRIIAAQNGQHTTPEHRAAADALRRLYDASSPKLYAFALRILKKPEWAEDVLQDCFIKIWVNAASFDAAKSAPMTWLCTIVRNAAFDLLRRNQHEHAMVDIDDELFDETRLHALAENGVQSHSNPSEQLSVTQDTAVLAQCFARLEGSTRQAIGMAFYHDMSHAEIADKLSQPLGTVKAWIRRGLTKLNTCLGQLGYVSSLSTGSKA